MQRPQSTVRVGYNEWLAQLHRPAHARRTAARFAAFLLPMLQPGMRLLDAGCGPGSITAGLAAAIAPGQVIGIDIAADTGSAVLPDSQPGPDFLRGDVHRLPFESGQFDVVVACALLQHLGQPDRALAELRRVLVPGGLIAIADADYGFALQHPVDSRVIAAMEFAERLRIADGGTPRVGRQLAGWLEALGFADIAVSVRLPCETGPALLRTAEFQALRLTAEPMIARAEEAGGATREELVSMAEGWREWARQPGATWGGGWFEVTARAQ